MVSTTDVNTNIDCTLTCDGGFYNSTDFTATKVLAYCSSSQFARLAFAGLKFDFSVLPVGITITNVYFHIRIDNFSFFDVVPDMLYMQWFPQGPYDNFGSLDFAQHAGYSPNNVFSIHTFDDMMDWWNYDTDAVPLGLINATGLNTVCIGVTGTDSSNGAGDYCWFNSSEGGYTPYAKVYYTLPSGGRSFAQIF